MADSKPTGLKATSGLELLTFGTPNGHKISMLLEELRDAYGLDYTVQSINIGQNIQKESWYTSLNPNGRIPTLIDHNKNSFPVFEGSAILAYLVRFYDPKHLFSFDPDSLDYSTAEQWVAWQHGGLGPMQGQANHFYRLAKERIAYPTQRYVGETERLYGVLDNRLRDRDYLVGDGKGKFSIADIANFSWVNFSLFAGVDTEKWPHLHAWWERVWARPAVKRGVSVPSESGMVNASQRKKLVDDEETINKKKELDGELRRAQEQYEYKYSSP